MKPHINSVEVHPHLSHNEHPMDGVCAGGCFFLASCYEIGSKDSPYLNKAYPQEKFTSFSFFLFALFEQHK
jgi:hypothetical protein